MRAQKASRKIRMEMFIVVILRKRSRDFINFLLKVVQGPRTVPVRT